MICSALKVMSWGATGDAAAVGILPRHEIDAAVSEKFHTLRHRRGRARRLEREIRAQTAARFHDAFVDLRRAVRDRLNTSEAPRLFASSSRRAFVPAVIANTCFTPIALRYITA